MHVAASSPVAPVAPVVLAWLRRAVSPGGTVSRQARMTTDNNSTAGAAAWGALIEAVAVRQDRAAFASLFEYFAPRIKAYMQRSGASEASAEELAQETMLMVWRKAALFDPASSGASAWIFTIARNLRIDSHRRAARGGMTEAVDVDLEFQVDERPQPDSQLATSQSEQRIRSALAQLSPEQMRVVELSFYEDKAHAEIAQMLGIPLGTVKSRLRLAMNRLRNLLSGLS
jgi:RNA polymerase sigma-70 factor (ECF subfamily)